MAESSPKAVADGTQPVLQAVSRSPQASEQPASEVTEFFGSLRPAISRTLLYIILLFVAVAISWAWWGKVDVVASAPFRLVPLGKVKTVQAARAGEIELIGIKEGDRVKKRQVLFKLRSWETWHELRELEQAKIALQKAKYDLEVALPRKQALTTETVAALKERLQLAQMFVATHRDVLDAYQTEMGAQNARDVSGKDADLKARINLRQAEVAHIKAQYERQKALFDRGLISQADMERARMAYLNALAQLPGRMSEIYQQEMAVQDIKRQILEAELSQDREASQAKYAYDAARLRLEQAQQKVTRNLDAESDLILAPEAGIVTQVLVNTERQVISKGQSLAMIAPETAPIVAEVMILNKDVGLMKPGQVVRLKYDAFAFQDYGIKRGWLSEIAPDAVVDEMLGPVFRGIVDLEETAIQVKGDEKPLMFGMKGVAEVVTDRQSVLMLLLSPLRKLYESATFTNGKET